MSDNISPELLQRIEDDIKRYYDGEGEQGYPGLALILREWARDLQAASDCAYDGGGQCPSCGAWAKRVAEQRDDIESEPNALWECTECKQRYYTCTDSIASSYRYLKRYAEEHFGFTHGAFPKQFKEMAKKVKES